MSKIILNNPSSPQLVDGNLLTPVVQYYQAILDANPTGSAATHIRVYAKEKWTALLLNEYYGNTLFSAEISESSWQAFASDVFVLTLAFPAPIPLPSQIRITSQYDYENHSTYEIELYDSAPPDPFKVRFVSATTYKGVFAIFVRLKAIFPPLLPATGATGFIVTRNGVTTTVTDATLEGDTVILALSAPVAETDVLTVSYSNGNVTDSSSPPNSLEEFGAQSVEIAPRIRNGSFEQPAVGNYDYTYNPPEAVAKWKFLSSSGVSRGYLWFNGTPPDGLQAAFIQGNGNIEQQINGLIAGNYYKISLYHADRPGYDPQICLIKVNGFQIGSFTSTLTTFQPYSSDIFGATSGSMTLRIEGTSTSGQGALNIDMVVVEDGTPYEDYPTVSFTVISADGTYADVTIEDEDALALSPGSYTGFTAKVEGIARSITSAVRQSDTVIRLTLASVIYQGQVVTVSYLGTDVEDVEGHKLTAFSDSAVVNNSTILPPNNPPKWYCVRRGPLQRAL